MPDRDLQGGKAPVCPHCSVTGQITAIESGVVLMGNLRLINQVGGYEYVPDLEIPRREGREPSYMCEACGKGSSLSKIRAATFSKSA